jgi:hypothetical protein
MSNCDWLNGLAGHCAGEVILVVVNKYYGEEYYACKRHHNLCVRAENPRIPKR